MFCMYSKTTEGNSVKDAGVRQVCVLHAYTTCPMGTKQVYIVSCCDLHEPFCYTSVVTSLHLPDGRNAATTEQKVHDV